MEIANIVLPTISIAVTAFYLYQLYRVNKNLQQKLEEAENNNKTLVKMFNKIQVESLYLIKKQAIQVEDYNTAAWAQNMLNEIL